ncbi:MAG: AhpC/TSA family protein [Paludibacteraceae bacterium]|nr:AhpC/TSA family protein [Paludibacteraceae bacterium]
MKYLCPWAACLLLSILTACQDHRFHIEGQLSGSDDKTVVYLEQLTLSDPVLLDSARLDSKGFFRFKSERPQYPDLYQLRIGRQAYIFPVDSTETIHIEAHVDSLYAPHAITGSAKALRLDSLRRSVRVLQAEYNQVNTGDNPADTLFAHLHQHRDNVLQLVVADPLSIVSYYAVLQKLGDYFIFAPTDKAVRAVATAMDAYMPDYYRSRELHNRVLMVLASDQRRANEQKLSDMIAQSEPGFIDISLPDYRNRMMRLSDLRGKVILLDFAAFSDRDNPDHIMNLRRLHAAYHERGLEIYQVSGDLSADEWRQAVASLPWICVYDMQASAVRSYNVMQLPTQFLFDRQGQVVLRETSVDRLNSEIERLL